MFLGKPECLSSTINKTFGAVDFCPPIMYGSLSSVPIGQIVISVKLVLSASFKLSIFEPPRDKTNEVARTPSENSDQPGHPPSLIRVFADRMRKAWVLSYPLSAQRSLWSDWADAQADLSLRWAHSNFVGFVMWRLIYLLPLSKGYQRTKLVSTLEKFYGRHNDLVDPYNVAVSRIILMFMP